MADALPPPWVPAFPPRQAPVPAAPATPASSRRRVRLGLAALLSALVGGAGALATQGQLGLGVLDRATGTPSPAETNPPRSAAAPLPTLARVSASTAGSSIDSTSYRSRALRRSGSFLVYLPPGYADSTRRYPVLYLLHGNEQRASAFLQIGLQRRLDGLIARHAITPMIAVMIQGGRGSNNWRDLGPARYRSYVLEVQQLVDRMLPTLADRDSRAIAGVSMGGYGAMNVALSAPARFAVVESWLGFFDGLQRKLRADRPVLAHTRLHAFLYGGASDRIADPGEDRAFASTLRANGVSARSAVYPGEHSLATIRAHLTQMLVLAGRELAASARARHDARPRAQHGRR
jgi:enterochelin esterase-like enzyme